MANLSPRARESTLVAEKETKHAGKLWGKPGLSPGPLWIFDASLNVKLKLNVGVKILTVSSQLETRVLFAEMPIGKCPLEENRVACAIMGMDTNDSSLGINKYDLTMQRRSADYLAASQKAAAPPGDQSCWTLVNSQLSTFKHEFDGERGYYCRWHLNRASGRAWKAAFSIGLFGLAVPAESLTPPAPATYFQLSFNSR